MNAEKELKKKDFFKAEISNNFSENDTEKIWGRRCIKTSNDV